VAQVLFQSWTHPERTYVADVQLDHPYGSVFSFDPAGPGSVTVRGVKSASPNSKVRLPEDDYHITLEVTYAVPGGLSHWMAYCSNGTVHHTYSADDQRPSYYDKTQIEATTLYRITVSETWDNPGPAVKGRSFTTVPVAFCDGSDP
jgi:hypothetical protein